MKIAIPQFRYFDSWSFLGFSFDTENSPLQLCPMKEANSKHHP